LVQSGQMEGLYTIKWVSVDYESVGYGGGFKLLRQSTEAVTIRVVVEVDILGKFKVLDDEKAAVRLGTGGRWEQYSEAAWQRALEALLRMKKIADGFGVKVVAAFATSAVRWSPKTWDCALRL